MEVAGVALVRSDFGGDRVDGWDGKDGRAGLVCLSKIDSGCLVVHFFYM